MVRCAGGRGNDGLFLLDFLLTVQDFTADKTKSRASPGLCFHSLANKLRCATLTVQVVVFFLVLSLSALFLLIELAALLSALPSLIVLTGLPALLAGLSALLSLLAIFFHIVCHK